MKLKWRIDDNTQLFSKSFLKCEICDAQENIIKTYSELFFSNNNFSLWRIKRKILKQLRILETI
jgi:hypothetical protein